MDQTPSTPVQPQTWKSYLAGIVALLILAVGAKIGLSKPTASPSPKPSDDANTTPQDVKPSIANEQTNPSANPTPTPKPVVTPTPAPTPKPTSGTTYKNGTYEAMGSYESPEGTEQIDVTLTIQNDLITDASAVPQAGGGISLRMQQIFADNFKPLVIGKKLSDVQLGKVSRSSLTPDGFNDAVVQIRAKAKA